MAHKHIEDINKLNGSFTQHTGAEESEEAYSFLVQTAMGLNRLIIPMNEKPVGEFKKHYDNQVGLESSRHKIQDIEWKESRVCFSKSFSRCFNGF